MLLGQIVAISVACNLFFTLLSVTEPKRGARLYARPTLWLSVLASLITVAISPYTDETTFLPNLLVMHVLLIIPLATESVTTAKDANRFCLSIDPRAFDLCHIVLRALDLAARLLVINLVQI